MRHQFEVSAGHFNAGKSLRSAQPFEEAPPTDIRIRDVRARVVNVPLEYPIRTAVGTALAKHGGVPLAVLLGGELQPVRDYDSHSMDGRPLASERAARAAEAGFTGIKTKIGYAASWSWCHYCIREDLCVPATG
jgi:hypothetical protein